MPHEIVLIVIVMLIWLMILRHFVVKYNKITFVSPNTAYINTRRLSEQKTNKTRYVWLIDNHDKRFSDVDSLRRGSEVSKASVVNKLGLLEDVIQKWRSETVLEIRNPINQREVDAVLDKNNIGSTFSVENGRKFQTNHRTRRISNATDDLRISKMRASKDLMPKYSIATVRPSQSYPLFRRIGSSSILNNPTCPEICYEDYDSIEAPPCSPNRFPCEHDEDELERCRLLAKLSGPRPENSEMLQPDGTIRRKVSEILLGHATIDIRRCSSISAYIRRPRANKNALVRRQSLFQSFRK